MALSACAAGDRTDAGWAGTVDTLPNGTVTVGNPPEGIWDEGDSWQVAEELRLGAFEGDGPEVFGEIRDVTADELGRVYVAEGQAQEIRVFASDGSFVRTVGRPGQGPGEFGEISALLWGPDGNLWAVDQSNSRYSVFDTAGTFRTSQPRRIGGFSRPWLGMMDPQGRLHDVSVSFESTAVIRHSPDLTSADTLRLPGHEPDRVEVEIAGGVMRMSIPFVPSLVWRLDPRGRLWFGTSDRYRLHQTNFAGDTLRTVERDYEPVDVNAAEREEALEAFSSDPIDPSRIPDTKPAFDRLHVDDRDHLWVIPEVADEEPGRFADIFDPEGRYLGRLTLPFRVPGAPVRFRDGFLYTVATDALDVPYVVGLRIMRP